MSRISLTSLKLKVWLVFLKRQSPPHRKLSLNVIREICIYLGSLYFLPCLVRNKLTIRNLEEADDKTMTLSKSFTSGCSFCWYRGRYIVFLGSNSQSSETWRLDFDSGVLTRLADMVVGRAWSGIAEVAGTIYAFGGNNSPPLKSCEKFEGSWTLLGDMHAPKTAFTPCVERRLVYLACPMPEQSNFEVFDVTTETFRELNVFIKCNGYGAVSFLADQTILILTYDRRIIEWKLESTTMATSYLQIRDCDLVITNTRPVLMDGVLYWSHYSRGDLVAFDLVTKTMRRDS